MANLAGIHLLNDGSLHQLLLGLNPDNTLSNISTLDGATIYGKWDNGLQQLTFTRSLADGTVTEYVGYYMELSSDGTPALAGMATHVNDDNSRDPPVGWYAAEDLPHIRLEPPAQTNPPSPPDTGWKSIPPDGRWEIVDGGTVGTLFIQRSPQGTLSIKSTLNSAQITGTWDPVMSELSFQQSFGDPIEGLVNIYDGFLALTAGDGSLVLAGTVDSHDREYVETTGWFAVFKGRSSMAPIAETNYVNPPFDVSKPVWPVQRVGTIQTYLSGSQPAFEWVPILNPNPMKGLAEVHGPVPAGGDALPGPGVEDAWTLPNRVFNELDSSQDRIVGVSGLTLQAMSSQEDMPFTHPLGNDYTFDIAPDLQYWPLLAIGDLDLPRMGAGWFNVDPETSNAVQAANSLSGANMDVPGVLHTEIDQGQIPVQYRPQDGDRVVVFGRWIIDAGHDDFGSEIHPPLMIVRAGDLGGGEYTSATLLGRAYLPSQIFMWNWDSAQTPAGLYDTIVGGIKGTLLSQKEVLAITKGDPNSRLGLDNRILPGVYGAPELSLPFILRPGSGRRSSGDRLKVSYKLSGRSGVLVFVQPLSPNVDAAYVRVIIAAPPPPPVPDTVPKSIAIYGPNSQLPPGVAQQVNQAVAELEDGIRYARGLEKYGLKDVQDQLAGLAQFSRDNFADEFLTMINNGVLMSIVPEAAWPSAPDVSGGQNPAGYQTLIVDNLKGNDFFGTPVNVGVDDTQAYPLAGRIDVFWQRQG